MIYYKKWGLVLGVEGKHQEKLVSWLELDGALSYI